LQPDLPSHHLCRGEGGEEGDGPELHGGGDGQERVININETWYDG